MHGLRKHYNGKWDHVFAAIVIVFFIQIWNRLKDMFAFWEDKCKEHLPISTSKMFYWQPHPIPKPERYPILAVLLCIKHHSFRFIWNTKSEYYQSADISRGCYFFHAFCFSGPLPSTRLLTCAEHLNSYQTNYITRTMSLSLVFPFWSLYIWICLFENSF